jgi:DUF971 family protein
MIDPPSNIRALQADQVLEVAWPDGRVDLLPYHTIRSQCPCAGCRDEWTGERLLDPAAIRQDLKLVGMENIGTYAVQFAWNDGHSSGLYTWETLQSIGDRDQAAG